MTVFLQPYNSVLLSESIMALQLFRESYFVLPDSTIIEVRLEQPEKTPSPMVVTLSGIVTLIKPVQLENA